MTHWQPLDTPIVTSPFDGLNPLKPLLETRLARLTEIAEGMADRLHWLAETIAAHDIVSLDCDRRGEEFCNCLTNEAKKCSAALAAYRAFKEEIGA